MSAPAGVWAMMPAIPPDRKRQTDALRIPFVAGQVDCEERTYARLHIREKKIEPVEAQQSAGRVVGRLRHAERGK